MGECQHDILISNLKDGEILVYPIIKVTGTIKRNAKCDKNYYNDCVFLKLNNSINNIKGKVINDKFKFIVKLEKYNNILELRYCHNAILNIKLNYVEIDYKYTILPLYIICKGHNGIYQAPEYLENTPEVACKKINLATQLLQCITAEKLYENNLDRKTFQFEDCRIFKSNLDVTEAKQMPQKDLWDFFAREIMSSKFADENKKYLAFLSCTWYNGDKYDDSLKTYEDFLKITDGYVALGGGGLALFGTASIFTWPEYFEEVIDRFTDETKIDRRLFLDDSCYRGTYGYCFSTTLGSVLHELYHTFDLGHTEKGIMSRGFDDIYKFFTDSEQHSIDSLLGAFQNKIEFKEDFEAEKLSERLQNETKKKNFSIIKKYDDCDDTHLDKSCAIMLYYHKWFNPIEESRKYKLTFDETSKFINSTNGMRLVEIRKKVDEMVIINWTFEGKVNKYYFQLPEEYNQHYNSDNLLVIIDSCGNILKVAL